VAVETPGHTMNHLAFALPEAQALFSGDHVMAWSTTIVAPPDGAMRAYMESLDKLRGRTEATYWPGHGGPVREPARFLRGLAGHRRQREAAIRARLEAGDSRVADIVGAIYQGLDPRLKGAAALSVLAHLEDLVGRGLAVADGAPTLEATYAPA
jgi:glyoxylase-like metal-dependent hydrolase (beta-lactamase superfamily II)